MYKIELTTNDNRETLLEEFYLDTWGETYDKIRDIQKVGLKSLIKVYDDNMEYMGDFTNIKGHGDKIQNKTTLERINLRPLKIIGIILLGILSFPFFLVIETAKRN